ncbi:MAG: polyprenyl synthetase family protein [Bacteroidota bacterium]
MHSPNHLLELFQRYREDNRFLQPPNELYAPIDYILDIGGKRIRPLLVLMACNLFKEEVEPALPAAYAVEIFHNFTLLHDDIMDNAPLRRGQPSVHVRYNTNTGILSGDVMLIYAYDYLLRVKESREGASTELLRLFNKSAIEVCEGQQLDMNFECRSDVQIPEYLRMIELKTAALLSGALCMGGSIGGASRADVDRLDLFGRKLGIAFQLQDDILDTFGDPEKFGKKVGGDIVQNKKTYLLLKAMEKADAPSLARLHELMEDGQLSDGEKVAAVTEIYNRFGVREEAQELQQLYTDEAYAALEAIEVASERKSGLKQMTSMLLGREY